MSYTREERRAIAENIMRYREEGIIHSCQERSVELISGRVKLPLREERHDASVWELQLLELVARDVLGLINHDTHPLELRTGHESRVRSIK